MMQHIICRDDVTEIPNEETVKAMLEAECIAKDPSAPHYEDVEEALQALKE